MSILLLLAGVGVFIAGIKQMSSGLEQSAGKGVRRLFQKISNNRLAGYGVGVGTTAIVQSSSATSVVTIGLANAGIVNVKQGAAIILGAKVGTTVTAFIFALSGLSKGGFSTGILLSSTAFIGVIMLLTAKKSATKQFATFLTGFGMLFLGLETMSSAISGSQTALGQALKTLFEYDAMKNPILLLLIGLVFTCIIQSSSVAIGIFIVFLQTGILDSVDQSFFLAMGANIGTCIDGVLAAFGSVTNGKRLALFHAMTSAMGAIFFLILTVIFRAPVNRLFGVMKPEWSLAIFNLSYNAIYTLILLPLLNPLVTLTEKIIKDKKSGRKQVLRFLDDRLLHSPAIVVSQLKKEVLFMAELAAENLELSFNALIHEDKGAAEKVYRQEKMLDEMNQEIALFLVRYSAVSQNIGEEYLIGTSHHVINDIERIGDHAKNFMNLTETIYDSGESFSPESLEELTAMYDKVSEIMKLGLHIYEKGDRSRLDEISQLEAEIDEMNSEYSTRHINRLRGEVSNVELQYYYDIISELERVSDHVVNIAFSIDNPTGKQRTIKAGA